MVDFKPGNWDIFKWIFGPDKRVSVQILRKRFSALDASQDICLFCHRQRQFHRRGGDHQFKEREN